MHGLLWPTCNHNHKVVVVASASAEIFRTSEGQWPWPWIRSRSYQHTQDYQHAQPSDCSLMHYWNMAIWILWNIDSGQSSNSRDSVPGRKFQHQTLRSCRSYPILSSPTISFELHTKMAEEIPRKVQFLELQKLCDLDLGSGGGHTGPHIWSRSTHTQN